jgi:hypothetical protein
LQGLPCVIKGRFPEGEAVDGGAMDRGQVGVVSFVTGVAGLTELLGGEGVDRSTGSGGGPEGRHLSYRVNGPCHKVYRRSPYLRMETNLT